LTRFSELCTLLSENPNAEYKELLLREYIDSSEDSDILWALYLLSGKKLSKQLSVGDFWEILPELSGIPLWLIEESFQISGDRSETISLLLPGNNNNKGGLSLSGIMEFVESLKDIERSAKTEKALNILKKLSSTEKYYFLRMISGSFSVVIEPGTIVNVLKSKYKLEEVSAYHLLHYLDPVQHDLRSLLSFYRKYKETLRVYPFNSTDEPSNYDFGNDELRDWQSEWKWDGVRAQLVYRNNELLIWSKRHGLLTDKFPELFELTRHLPGGIVIDGEIIAFSNGKPLPYNILKSRMSKRLVTKAAADAPAAFIAFDIMEYEGADISNKPLSERRVLLEKLIASTGNSDVLFCSPVLEIRTMRSLEELKVSSHQNNCRGIILKRKNSVYSAPGSRVSMVNEPYSITAVMLYAQKGAQSDVFSEFTFGVWNEEEFITFAKANSGLSIDELKEIELFVKENTLEKFGPVRIVKPELVFELQFEGVFFSRRHKAGLTLRNPRISRWLKDKKPDDAGHLSKLKDILNAGS